MNLVIASLISRLNISFNQSLKNTHTENTHTQVKLQPQNGPSSINSCNGHKKTKHYKLYPTVFYFRNAVLIVFAERTQMNRLCRKAKSVCCGC